MISSISDKISNFIIAKDEKPHIRCDNSSITKSNQPHLLGRPVVVPNSWPLSLIISPTSSSNSVGNGPEPTRVRYALVTPTTFDILEGAIPEPKAAPAVVGLEEVTKGYVPYSISICTP